MAEQKPLNILCIAGSLLGRPFMMEAKKLGHRIYVLTTEKCLKEAWPRGEYIDDIFAVPNLWDEKVVRNAVSYIARDIKFDRIVPMGDWEMETASFLREHFRSPGMGETTMRYFRDKLAMRMKAKEDGVPVPEFTPLFNWKEIHDYLDRVPAPWIIKPRQEAASMGITKINNREELWPLVDKLGDKMSLTLLEKYTPGDDYHDDSVVHERKVAHATVNRYGTPMLDLNKTGGMFTTRNLKKGSPDEVALQELNQKVITSLGLVRGVTHIEYIKSREDGKFYFLEAGARVGAARIPDVAWHATGVCLWHEWARIEIAQGPTPLSVTPKEGYAGTIITLANAENPDLSRYTDPEIVYRQARKWHAGLIVRSDSQERVEELIQQYAERFARDFVVHVPMKA
ncbi:MAG TPA: ATP-grasp domain-containing protein [Oscillatoriaceae cyanobacterium]